MYKDNSGPKASNPQQPSARGQALSLRSEGAANATEGPCFRKPNCSLFGNSTLISFWETTPPHFS